MLENALPGDTDWDVSGSGSPSIQGFANDMSVNVGGTIQFKIDTPSTNYRIDIYRLGYYGGAGARKVHTIDNADITKLSQPACGADPSTGLIDCGNWGTNASWAVPSTAVSGIYIARPVRQDGAAVGQASHIVFVVRDDARAADILLQTSDTTWQAYNLYGGNSLYCGAPYTNAGTEYGCAGRAVKVSYNRPFDTRDHDPQSFLFNAEYPMVRFLEANGYNVKYWSGVDTDRFANTSNSLTAKAPKIFLSVGHDEYWSGTQRAHVESARNAGVNLSFMSGNEVYWKTRWEGSIAGAAADHRTLVSYKETLAGSKIDPSPEWTGTWRDSRGPADHTPENALIGSMWTVNCCGAAITVPSSMSGMRLWRNTRVASLLPGETATLAAGSLGYEWGEVVENGFQPDGIVRLSSTTLANQEKIIDFGAHVGIGTATHSLTLYKHQSGALVFGASTVQWAWGLDGEHDANSGSPAPDGADQAMQQATVNLFADMGAQPATLQNGVDGTPLIAAAASNDIFAPTSTITSPASNATVESGKRVTISGTAFDTNGPVGSTGVVGSVEVSVDGGATWRKATGTTAWSFDWTPGVVGSATIQSRATDDSGNVEIAGPGVTVAIVVGECPCESLWKSSVVPSVASAADSSEYELGVKFKSDVDGFITGIRFYKGPSNTGTHAGHLWTAAGELLATAVFTNETATGWQRVDLPSPVAITADTVYVASYHVPNGGYAFDAAYFAAQGVDSPPLHALASGASGGNGVFSPGPTAFPTNTFNANNYWVDVVFAQSLTDDVAPEITGIRATTIDSSRVTVRWTTNEAANTRIDYGTDPSILTATLATLPAGTTTVSSASFVEQHEMALNGLLPNTTYFYLVSSTDAAGNRTTVAAPSVTLPGPTLRDTTATDFSAGTTASTYVSQTGDGEVILAPLTGAEFTGPDMPPGWAVRTWDPQGSATIVDGILLVDGARVASCATPEACASEDLGSTASAIYTAPKSLEFSANFSGDQFQHAGFAVTFSSASEPWAIFSTLSGGMLFARTNTGNGAIDTPISVLPLGEFHRYRIDWNPTSVDYYIDGALVASHNVTVAGPMRPVAASDFNPFGGIVFVDWMRLMPHVSPGAFESRIFDATTSVDWKSIQWAANIPAGTAMQVSVRSGDAPVPDGSWTAWLPLAGPQTLALHSRYVQYRVDMTSGATGETPELQDIIITTGGAPTAVDDFASVAQNGSYLFPASGTGSLVANDTDPDAADTLRVVAVTAPSHGAATLNDDGSVTYVPATNYNGPDSFVYTMSDGLLTSSATVTMDVRFGNVPPVANTDFFAVNEDTMLIVPGSGVLANDTDVENDPLTATLLTMPLHGMLTFNGGGSFTYTPTLNYAGPDVFTYRAYDGADPSNSATVNIMVNQVNDPPYTVADAFTAILNQPLDVPAPGVLANDKDVEVEDTAPLKAQLVSTTSHGDLTLRDDGSFSYVPSNDFLGTDSFVYAAVDHFGAVSTTPQTVTLTVAIKAVSASVSSGDTVSTGGEVSTGDPLRSQVTTPTDATVSIAQGVISGSTSPTGYTFLNQQINITVLNADGSEVTASAANPLVLAFDIDLSLVPAGQDKDTFQVFRNNVLVPNCLGATSIPAANLDPCVSTRSNGDKIHLTILTTHASHWNLGVESASLGAALTAIDDGPFSTNFETPLTIDVQQGVLKNDFGGSTITAELFGAPLGGDVALQPSGSFVFTPAPGFCGAASFQYRVHDDTDYSEPGTVSITVNCRPVAVDDGFSVLEDSGTTAFTVLQGDSDPDGQPFTVTAVTQGANGTVLIGGGGGFVSYQPIANFFGTDSFTYTITDSGGASSTATVSVQVLAVNDAPGFVKGGNQTTLEDAAPQAAANWATGITPGPLNEISQGISFVTSNDNPGLFVMQPEVSPDGTLTYQPAADATGSATVTVSVRDDGGTADGGIDTSAAQTFTISVTPVNDVPSFVKGADQHMNEDSGAQSIPGWATAISAGPASESGQAVNFLVSNDNAALFSVPPAVSPDGTLTYDPAPNANGTATVSVRVHDDGGTADGGVDTSEAQTFTIAVSLLNDAPSFTPGANPEVNEDAGPQTIAWATSLSAGPADESAQALTFVIDSNSNAALFSAGPAIAPNGTLTFTAAPNAFGVATVMVRLTDDGGTLNGGVDSSAPYALLITVNAVNDAPSFVKGPNQSVLVNSGPSTIANWATAISVGPANEAAQTPSFSVTNTNTALFSAQPAIAPNGTLTFTPAAGMTGSATVTAVLNDDGGTAFGGINASAPQMFTITVVQGTTATAVASSNSNALFGTAVTFTATVTPAPLGSVAGGTVTFFRAGTTAIGTGVLDALGQATLTTTTLAAGTHSITAVYGGSLSYAGSTSPAISQVISPSSKLTINFTAHALQDGTNRPKVREVPIDGALVRVYRRWEQCTSDIYVSPQPKKWGLVFDGADGPDGQDGCPVLTFGSYRAEGTTDANGNVTIIVPPTSTKPNIDYLVVGRSLDFNVTTTPTDGDAIYSGGLMPSISSGATKKVSLHEIRMFNGKRVAGRALEEFGSYLAMVQPEEIEWTEDEVLYPVVLVAEGDWDVTTSLATPSGFVTEEPVLSAQVVDAVEAMQFTVVDVGSEWTPTTVNHVIKHKGTNRIRSLAVPMINRKATRAKKDFFTVDPGSADNLLEVLVNDNVAPPKTLTITGVTGGINGGIVTIADGSRTLLYTPPNAAYVGRDEFTYTIQDSEGVTSTGTVKMRVNTKPSLVIDDISILEGNSGSSTALFTVTLSSPSENEISFDYATADGTAVVGTDYSFASGTVTLAPGETTKTIPVQIIGNLAYQHNRRFEMSLWLDDANKTNAKVFGGVGKAVIVDDDPKPRLSSADVSVVEGQSGSTLATVTVTLTGETMLPASVDYLTGNATASAGSDYASTSGTLTFAPGETSKTVDLSIVGDTTAESTEMFNLSFTSAVDLAIDNNSAKVWIIDDDSTAWINTTVNDFNKGTVDDGAYISRSNNGEVILAPVLGTEFAGSELAAAWISTPTATGGGTTLDNNKAAIDGASVVGGDVAGYGPDRSIEFTATFSGEPGQWGGFSATGDASAPFAMFGTRVANTLVARTVVGTTTLETTIKGNNINTAQRFRIEWNASAIVFRVNDKVVATHNVVATEPMRPTLLDTEVGGKALVAQYVRLTPYSASGNYTSAVFDAGGVVTWLNATWESVMPAGTTVAVTYRTGNTPIPDASWTAFAPVDAATGAIAGTSRYFQFRVKETTSDVQQTPVVKDVTLAFKR